MSVGFQALGPEVSSRGLLQAARMIEYCADNNHSEIEADYNAGKEGSEHQKHVASEERESSFGNLLGQEWFRRAVQRGSPQPAVRALSN
jgi:hypothetical protein